MKGASKSDSELTYKKIIAWIHTLENSSKDDYCKVFTSRKYARYYVQTTLQYTSVDKFCGLSIKVYYNN